MFGALKCKHGLCRKKSVKTMTRAARTTISNAANATCLLANVSR